MELTLGEHELDILYGQPGILLVKLMENSRQTFFICKSLEKNTALVKTKAETFRESPPSNMSDILHSSTAEMASFAIIKEQRERKHIVVIYIGIETQDRKYEGKI